MDFIKKLQIQRSDYKYASQARTQAESLKQLSAGIYTEEERFVYELLQNAVDAFVETRNSCLNIKISIKDNILCFMHNGSAFSERDIEGLCDVGHSNKADNDKSTNKKKVGYKGIGFKSVFMQSVDYVCVKSGSYCFKFDKEECAKLMPSFSDGVLDADDTPWQIVPISCSAPSSFNTTNYNVATFIKSSSIKNLGTKIKKMLEDPQFLLFLNADDININFFQNSTKIISAGRKTSNGEVHLICDNNVVSRWLVHTTKPILVDYSIRNNLKNDFNTPPKLKEATDFEISFAVSISEKGEIQEVKDSVLYTFLPTSYKNLGVPFLINANFITDAGRQQLHQHSEWNRLIFASIPKHFFKWVAVLSLKHHDFYKILPNIKPKSSDELTNIFTDNFQTALNDIAFIPSRKDNDLLRVKEAINDKIDFASVASINTLISHINKEYSKSFNLKSFFDCEDCEKLVDYGVFCFDINKLKAYFEDQDSIGIISAQRCKEFIEFFVSKTEESDSKDRIMSTIKECTFLLCDDNKVRKPSNCYFPTEYSTENSTNVPLIHSDVFKYIKTNHLFDWFKDLGVENMSVSNYLNDVYCKRNYNITTNNAIEVGKIIYEAFLKGSLDSIPEKYLKRLKFLSTKEKLLYADELYLSHIYYPQIDLEDMIDDDMFVSEKYAEYGDINIWKSIFLHLGMSENLHLTKRRYYKKIKDICTVQDSHASELAIIEKDFNNLPTYYSMYAYELEYYPAVINISNHEILTKLFSEIFKSAYKKSDDSCYLYYRWNIEEHLRTRGDFLKKKNDDFNIREFILKYCQLYPTTTGEALHANEILLNTEINSLICGEYLPVLDVNTPLSESWASILPFKRDLQIEDLLALLTKIANDKENDNKDRISAIYKRIIELGLQNSPSIKEWGKHNLILTKRDGEFLPPSEVSYITIDGFKSSKRVYTGKIEDSLKDGLLDLFRNMGVRVIDKVTPVFKDEKESSELRELLAKRAQYIAILKKEADKKKSFPECKSQIENKIRESSFIHCKSISLSYGDENDVIEKNTFSQENAFYYTGSLKASKIEPLLEPLCKYFGIRGYSSELLIILITSEHDELVEFLVEKGYDTSKLEAPVSVRSELKIRSGNPSKENDTEQVETYTEENTNQNADDTIQESFGKDEGMPTELLEKNIANINAAMEGTGFTLSSEDRNAEHIIIRFRVLEFIKTQGFKLAPDFNEQEYIKLSKYSAIPLANGIHVNVQGAKYGIWNVSPGIWDDIVEDGNYMCLCVGNGEDDFILIKGENDIKTIAEKTNNVFIRLTATNTMDIMSTIKSILTPSSLNLGNIKIKEIYTDRDVHLMLLVHKTKDKPINSMYYTDFSSDGGSFGF